jgi:hypothetical protein
MTLRNEEREMEDFRMKDYTALMTGRPGQLRSSKCLSRLISVAPTVRAEAAIIASGSFRLLARLSIRAFFSTFLLRGYF